MVAWIVNDLSLVGQYGTLTDFLADFEAILHARARLGTGHTLDCARDLRYRQVYREVTLLEAVHQMKDQARRNLALAWLTKGPFWISPSKGEEVTYFHHQDVTAQGLGEAARRRWINEDARSFSFKGPVAFEDTPLQVECLRDGSDIHETIPVPNLWVIDGLVPQALANIGPSDWTGMVDEACKMFTHLQVARDQIMEEMCRYPFDLGASRRLTEVLKHLDQFARLRAQHGEGSRPVTEWLSLYVQGKHAEFSSEEPKNKHIFMFIDPETGEKIYCPWHGKVHNPLQFRIHFQWPMPAGQQKLKVLFIGEKLTKR